MKFQYFGTAAAEGWPALFCTCDNCRRAAKAGGRNLRTRSQAAVDDKLLIDFPADTLAHMYYSGLDLPRIRDCIITHSHSDHLYPADLEMRLDGFAYPGDDRPLVFYATKEAAPEILEMLEKCGLIKQNRVLFQEIRPFEPFEAAGYTVTPLPANHDPASGPVFFLIEDGEKSLLYANDTGWFPEEDLGVAGEAWPASGFRVAGLHRRPADRLAQRPYGAGYGDGGSDPAAPYGAGGRRHRRLPAPLFTQRRRHL